MVLAHELQHVREVLDAGIGTDPAAIDSLFTRIGVRQLGTPTQRYETAAAQEVMAIVAREMRALPSRLTPQVTKEKLIVCAVPATRP